MAKIHSINHLEAEYLEFGRKWMVRNLKNNSKSIYDNILELVKAHPEFMELPSMMINLANAKERKRLKLIKIKQANTKLETNETPIQPNKITRGRDFMIVSCYYCDGSGKSAYVKCPNCNGTGEIKVTAKGF
ncbi:MAG: hypothetical protein COW03_12490 [Cytophagales bacterium CG12_big_fil_rev_8_21_14_0_65_40_12]|nr:MAG: hypothetical protein COW03_12490 [Cytophagales bacterium CG12_big_fil_rev_8_21_14_0_65_40_12]PIW04911.1 MAG: hypothetical protein COW40_07575 [Cytophagales bacterium CG17_big_fil_post_rev_8_21_14_2_50_40_13]